MQSPPFSVISSLLGPNILKENFIKKLRFEKDIKILEPPSPLNAVVDLDIPGTIHDNQLRDSEQSCFFTVVDIGVNCS